MSQLNNKIKKPIDTDPRGVSKVVDSDVLGQKAIPVVFVTKQEDGFTYNTEVDDSQTIDNRLRTNIERDSKGNIEVVDSDVDGNKAVPLVVVTKNEDGKFEYASLGSGGSVSWDDVTNKPSEFPPEDHTHVAADITDLGALATEDNVDWDDVNNKPTTFTPSAHTHNASDINAGTLDAARIPTLDQSKITNLVSDLTSKLTATKAAYQAHSSAEDLETLVSDFNDLLDKLIAAGIMESE